MIGVVGRITDALQVGGVGAIGVLQAPSRLAEQKPAFTLALDVRRLFLLIVRRFQMQERFELGGGVFEIASVPTAVGV